MFNMNFNGGKFQPGSSLPDESIADIEKEALVQSGISRADLDSCIKTSFGGKDVFSVGKDDN